MRGRTGLAKFYSFCLWVSNVFYCIKSGLSGIDLAFALFFATIIPVSVYYVAEEVKAEHDAIKEPDELNRLVEELHEKTEENIKLKKRTLKTLSK
jgi:hypothetical protein